MAAEDGAGGEWREIRIVDSVLTVQFGWQMVFWMGVVE